VKGRTEELKQDVQVLKEHSTVNWRLYSPTPLTQEERKRNLDSLEQMKRRTNHTVQLKSYTQDYCVF